MDPVVIEFVQSVRIPGGIEYLPGTRIRLKGNAADFYVRRGWATLVETTKPKRRTKKNGDSVDATKTDSTG